MSKAQMVLLCVVMLCGLLAIGAVLVWAQPCAGSLELANGNMVPMKCRWTANVGALLGVLVTASGFAGLASRKPLSVAYVATLAIVSFALYLITLTSPFGIGVCAADGMACHATALWLRGCGLVAMIAIIATIFVSPDRKRVVD